MKRFRILLALAACSLVLAERSVFAATLLYEISGDVVGLFQPFDDDAAADLLGVPRSTQNTVPFSLKLTVNANAAPTLVNDNSLGQEAIYPDAILSAKLVLNGAVFESQRKFEVFSKQSSEASLQLINLFSPKPDTLVLKVIDAKSGSAAAQTALFGSRTVPFNQTSRGITYTTATIGVANLVLGKLGREFLSSIDLPKEGDTISSESMNFNFLLATALNTENQTTPRQSTVSMGALAATGSNLKFTITTIPDPEPSTPEPSNPPATPEPTTPIPEPTTPEPTTPGTGNPTTPVSGSAHVTQAQRTPVMQVGESNRYTIRFTNTSSFPAAKVKLTNMLPKRSKTIAAESSQGHCRGQRRQAQCNLGTVAPGATVSAEVDMVAGRAGNFENRAVISYRMQPSEAKKRKRSYSVESRIPTTITEGPVSQ